MWKIINESELTEALDATKLKTAADICDFN